MSSLLPFLQHPAFQSVFLPAVLTWAGIAALRALPSSAGRDAAPLGAVLALAAALAVLPGFAWPATSSAQKLPWVVLAGLVLGVVITLLPLAAGGPRTRHWGAWCGAALCWVGVSLWLGDGRAAPLRVTGMVLTGAAALAWLVWGGHTRPALQRREGRGPEHLASAAGGGTEVAAALTVAALGLAALAGTGGSLLLAQLALMVASVTGMLCLWTWLWPGSGVRAPTAGLLPLGLAWLAIAQLLPALTGVGMVPLALLLLAWVAPWFVVRFAWAVRRPRLAALAVAALAAVPVALAVGWQLGTANPPAADTPSTELDDPYYTPQWK